MRIQEITIDDIELAYKKLKSYIYHENFNLHLRLKLAKYESEHDLREKFIELREILSDCSGGDYTSLKEFIDEINYTLVVKSFYEKTEKECENQPYIFTENNENENHNVEKYNPFIDCPIEIHLISIIWVLKVGDSLEESLSTSCYGNRLYQNSEGEIDSNSLKLFYPYFKKYNEWRDASIKKAKELHNMGLDVILLNLDIKEYYHSVDFNLSNLKLIQCKEWEWLNEILSLVHEKFIDLVFCDKILQGKKRKILPIGLISSNILANYYLKEFDQLIIEKDRPAHYGRYVDDINIVYANPRISGSLNDFPKNRLTSIKSKIGKTSIDFDDAEKNIVLQIDKNSLLFQLKKVKIFYFKKSEPITVLNEFEKVIQNNSSEFKFLPETSDVMESFETACYKLSYTDTINKIRSIDKFAPDKLGASKHLSKLIMSTKYIKDIDKNNLDRISKEINSFFSGQRGILLNSLWEKVITFYVVNKNKGALIEFSRNILQLIEKVKFTSDIEIIASEKRDKTSKIKKELVLHFINSLSMASAIDEKFLTEDLINTFRIKKAKSGYWSKLDLSRIQNNTEYLIKSNLLRHNYIIFPLVNYQAKKLDSYRNDKISNWLIKSEYNGKLEKEYESVDDGWFNISMGNDFKVVYSPRFIHYHEMCLFDGLKKLNSSDLFYNQDDMMLDFIKRSVADKNFKINFQNPVDFNSNIQSYKIPGNEKTKRLKVGLVNIKVNSKNSFDNFKGKPNLCFKRLYELHQVLNQALVNKCDLIVFPEISIPFQWMPIITEFSRKSDIGIICGVEHLSNEANEVFNYAAVILPFMLNEYRNAFIDFRLKKDYSPAEEHYIEGHTDYVVPHEQMNNEKLRLYEWKGMFFSVFNCFELSDISKRSIFKGKVDFVVAVEHNKDVNYFSNISESVVRDIHSFFIQVNTSQYGDSRIVSPSSTVKMNIAKIKGGENISLLTGYVDIASLRDFQTKDFALQDKDENFKPTPPGFELYDKRK